MGLTLNQVITRLKFLGQSHRQINTVRVVSFDEALDESDIIYPACLIVLQKDWNANLNERLAKFRFRIYFLDPMDVAVNSRSNEYEVKSDMVSVALDYVAMSQAFDYMNDWDVVYDSQGGIATFELQDLTAGVYVDLNIGVRFDANRCQIPRITIEGNRIFSEEFSTEYE